MDTINQTSILTDNFLFEIFFSKILVFIGKKRIHFRRLRKTKEFDHLTFVSEAFNKNKSRSIHQKG